MTNTIEKKSRMGHRGKLTACAASNLHNLWLKINRASVTRLSEAISSTIGKKLST